MKIFLMLVALVIITVFVAALATFLFQELDAWLWHWWHYTRPLNKEKRAWNRRYKDFERRNRW